MCSSSSVVEFFFIIVKNVDFLLLFLYPRTYYTYSIPIIILKNVRLTYKFLPMSKEYTKKRSFEHVHQSDDDSFQCLSITCKGTVRTHVNTV